MIRRFSSTLWLLFYIRSVRRFDAAKPCSSWLCLRGLFIFFENVPDPITGHVIDLLETCLFSVIGISKNNLGHLIMTWAQRA